MKRSYRFRLRPTAKQHVALQEMLRDHCELYNDALTERRLAWEWNGKSVSCSSQRKQLPDIRRTLPHQGRWSSHSQQRTLLRLDRAFDSFFRRIKSGQRAGYPRYKPCRRWNSVEHTEGNGARWTDAKRVYIQGIGHIKATVHRNVEGKIKSLRVKREGRRWYVILSCDHVPVKPLPLTGASLGIDLGIANFATTSDGDHISNPRYARLAASQLAISQQRLASKRRGSNNRMAAAESVAKRHRKIRNKRRDFHFKIAKQIVGQADLLCLERLQVAGMSRRAKPRIGDDGIYLPNNGSAKRGLNKGIRDAGWGQFVNILVDKAEEAGRQVVFVDPRHTSQRCHNCGHIEAGNRVCQAEFRCLVCNYREHADINAAKNILRAGLALQVSD